MRSLAALILFIAILALPGCLAPYRYQDVTFKVVDAETGEPIERATFEVGYGVTMFEIHPPKSAEATTGPDGFVRVRAANFHGEFDITVTAPDYIMIGQRATIRERPSQDKFRLVVLPDGALNTVALFAEPIPTGTIVLPQGFQGLLRYPRETESDTEPQPGQREFAVSVGDDGIVRLPTSGVARYTRWKLRYSDDTLIPEGDEMAKIPVPGTAWYQMIGGSDSGRLDYVGNYATARTAGLWMNNVTFDKYGGSYSTSDRRRANEVWEHGLSAIPE